LSHDSQRRHSNQEIGLAGANGPSWDHVLLGNQSNAVNILGNGQTEPKAPVIVNMVIASPKIAAYRAEMTTIEAPLWLLASQEPAATAWRSRRGRFWLSDLSWPHAAIMSRPRGARTGEA
jgi:hypothetical protein